MSSDLLKGESPKIIALILLGWTLFSFADANTKNLAETFNPSFLTAFVAGFNAIIVAVIIAVKEGPSGFKWHSPKLCFARIVCTGFISLGVVQSLARIPIADMYGITFTSPFLSVVFAYFLLKEQVGWHRWLCVILGFTGVFILVGPQFKDFNSGLLYATFAMIFMALNTIVLRKAGKCESTLNLVLLAFIGMFCINFYFAWGDFVWLDLQQSSLFILNALLVLAAISLTTYSLSHANNTASVAPFLYVQAIWGVLFGLFFFNNVPTATTYAGLAIVISAGLYMMYRERLLNKGSA